MERGAILSETVYYSPIDLERDIGSLIRQLEDKPFDLIVGVNRGGCIPAVCLSHALRIPATMIDFSTRDGANIHPKHLWDFFYDIQEEGYSNPLIVDDLIDSGKSMSMILDCAIEVLPRTYVPSVATLLTNTDVNLKIDHYVGTKFSRSQEPRFFDFFWECYGK